jgi:hypothetical protein
MSHWGYAKVDDVAVTAPDPQHVAAKSGPIGWITQKIKQEVASVRQAHALENFRSIGQDGSALKADTTLANSG